MTILAVLYLVVVIVHVISYAAQGRIGAYVIAVSNIFGLVLGTALAIVVIV
jgi:hypothetical protein